MIYAQILNGVIANIIQLDDITLLSIFSQGYDTIIEIDNLNPMPIIGWYWDIPSQTFYPPITLALVVDNVIINIIQNCEPYIAANSANYQAVINITTLPIQPTVGATLNSDGSFTQPSIPSTFYQNATKAAMALGQQLIVNIIAQSMSQGIIQSGKSADLIMYCQQVILYLQIGALYNALTGLEAMLLDNSTTKTALAPFWTNTIIQANISQIQQFLGILPS